MNHYAWAHVLSTKYPIICWNLRLTSFDTHTPRRTLWHLTKTLKTEVIPGLRFEIRIRNAAFAMVTPHMKFYSATLRWNRLTASLFGNYVSASATTYTYIGMLSSWPLNRCKIYSFSYGCGSTSGFVRPLCVARCPVVSLVGLILHLQDCHKFDNDGRSKLLKGFGHSWRQLGVGWELTKFHSSWGILQ